MKLSIFTLALLSLVFVTTNASAAPSIDSIYNNVLANMLHKCYDELTMRKEVNMEEYTYNALITDSFREYVLMGNNKGIVIPTAVGTGNNTVADNKDAATAVTCDTLFLGEGKSGSINNVFKQFGKVAPDPRPINEASKKIGNIGYTKETMKSDFETRICINATATYELGGVGGNNTGSLGKICWRQSDLETIADEMGTNSDLLSRALQTKGENNAVTMWLQAGNTDGVYMYYKDNEEGVSCSIPPNDGFGNGVTVGYGYDNLIATIKAIGDGDCQIMSEEYQKISYSIKSSVSTDLIPFSSDIAIRSMPSYDSAYGTARQYLTGDRNVHLFGKDEKFALYNEYLFSSEVYNASWVSGETCLSREELKNAGGPVQEQSGKYYAYKDGKYCRVSFPLRDNNPDLGSTYYLDVSVFDKDITSPPAFTVYMEAYCPDAGCLLKMIYGLNLPDKPDDPDNPDNPDDPDKPGGGTTVDTEEDFCDSEIDKATNGEGIGAMQWVLCPSLSNTTYTADWIDGITQDWLEVNSDVYKPGGSVYKFTDEIKKVADVLMTAFLLVIIFSQLTGYGIDNYGIKKMLPRLIVMAIIVNLAYYICAIAIDLSNVAGEGLRNMFGSMGNFIAGGGAGAGGNGFVKTGVLGLFSAAAGGGGAAMSAAGVALSVGAAGWVAIVVAAIVLVLVVIVAVIIMYLMLGVRNVIVIFCIVVSPLAFAMFILPNTQHLFKKWWELFKAAIIIYPICGAMSGISYALKNMNLGETSGVATQMIVIVLPYLGFFLIPMLIKNAIAALGKIGGALTAVGNTMRQGGRMLGSGAMRGVQNTEAYKNRQLEAARNRQLRNAERTIRRLDDIKKNGGELDEAQTRRLARAHETQRKLGLEDQAARTVLTEREYANVSKTQLIDDWKTAFKNGNTERMDALTNVITSKYGPGGASDMAKELAEMDDIFHDDNMSRSFASLQANMLQNKALATNMQNKASDAYQMISGGGFGEDGNRHNLKWHAAHNGMATQVKDWATQSSATLRRAAKAGGLSKEMANNILSSTDPAIRSGVLSDTSKRAALVAAANGYEGDWSADSVTNFANQFDGGMDANYINRDAESVADEAWAENAARAAGGGAGGAGGAGGSGGAGSTVDMNGGDGDGATGEVE